MVAKEFKTGNIIIMWEGSSSKGFRKKMFKDYKVNRSENKSPEEIQEKIEFNKEANEMYEKCLSLGFVGYSLEGYEADDLIAYYCNLHPDEEIIIVSNDEDMYQCLVHDNVTIYNIDKKKKKNKKWFKEEYGIHPDLWVMVKSVGGCKSDGVPGVPGVAEKTAIKYLLGTSSKNINDKIAQYSLDIKRNIELVKIPMDRIKQEDFYFLNKKTNLNKKKFIDLCFELDFRYFLDQITEFDIFCNGGK